MRRVEEKRVMIAGRVRGEGGGEEQVRKKIMRDSHKVSDVLRLKQRTR